MFLHNLGFFLPPLFFDYDVFTCQALHVDLLDASAVTLINACKNNAATDLLITESVRK